MPKQITQKAETAPEKSEKNGRKPPNIPNLRTRVPLLRSRRSLDSVQKNIFTMSVACDTFSPARNPKPYFRANEEPPFWTDELSGERRGESTPSPDVSPTSTVEAGTATWQCQKRMMSAKASVTASLVSAEMGKWRDFGERGGDEFGKEVVCKGGLASVKLKVEITEQGLQRASSGSPRCPIWPNIEEIEGKREGEQVRDSLGENGERGESQGEGEKGKERDRQRETEGSRDDGSVKIDRPRGRERERGRDRESEREKETERERESRERDGNSISSYSHGGIPKAPIYHHRKSQSSGSLSWEQISGQIRQNQPLSKSRSLKETSGDFNREVRKIAGSSAREQELFSGVSNKDLNTRRRVWKDCPSSPSSPSSFSSSSFPSPPLPFAVSPKKSSRNRRSMSWGDEERQFQSSSSKWGNSNDYFMNQEMESPRLRRSLSARWNAPLCSDIDERDSVDALMDILRKKSSFSVKKKAITELKEVLKRRPEKKARIVAIGGVQVLVAEITKLNDIGFLEDGVLILLHLTLTEDCQDLIMEAQGVELLVEALQMVEITENLENSRIVESAMAVLVTMCHNEEAKMRMWLNGAIPACLRVLEVASLRMKKDAALLLFCLSTETVCACDIVRFEAVETLLSLATDPTLEEKVSAVLANLCCLTEGLTAVARNGGVPILEQVVERGSGRAKEDASYCLLALAEFARGTESTSPGSVSEHSGRFTGGSNSGYLREFVSETDFNTESERAFESGRVTGVTGRGKKGKGDAKVSFTVEAGAENGVDYSAGFAAVNVTGNSGSFFTRGPWSVPSSPRNSEAGDSFGSQNFSDGEDAEDFESLINSVRSGDLEDKKDALKRLRVLVKNKPRNKKKVISAGGIEPLVSVLQSGNGEMVENAVTIILNLSLNDEKCREELVESGGIDALVDILDRRTHSSSTSTSSSCSVKTMENTAATLFSLSKNRETSVLIRLAGGVRRLVTLLNSTSLRGRKDAALVLFNLSLDPVGALEIVNSDAVKILLELVADTALEEKAVAVLGKLALISEGRKSLYENGCIPILVEVLEGASKRAKEDAACCLLALAQNLPKSLDFMLAEGAMLPLVTISSGSSRARAVAKTLIQLLRSRSHKSGR